MSDTSFSYVSIGSEIRNGEYIGIDAFANKIIPVWTDDRSGSPNQEIYSSNLSILVSVNNKNKNVPDKYTLYQNFPNPFNPTTNIRYTVPKTTHVSLKVYDLLGNEFADLIDGYSAAGDYTISFDASKLSSGIYFYTFTAGSFKESKKMILLK